MSAAYQFVALVRQRRQETTLTLMKTAEPPALFSSSIRRIFELPNDAPPEAIHALGPELEQAVLQACVNFENLGYLVYARLIPLHMADNVVGGMVRLTWRKNRSYLMRFRADSPAAFEWLEWLYDRFEQYPSKTDSAVGAHVTRRSWKP
ncbi:MAG: hypothetical protein FJ034_05135 [Chloroflexi bacterium]|nr:hypothetical protein [Chloroflexota bacterium]